MNQFFVIGVQHAFLCLQFKSEAIIGRNRHQLNVQVQLLDVQMGINILFAFQLNRLIFEELAINLLMRQSQKICHRVQIKLQKELQGYRRRQQRHLQGVAKLIMGKLENNTQQIWIDDLKNEPILKLKEYNNSQKGYIYAKTIINACCSLANYYGFFIINENMIFFNAQREVFAWINPNILQNHIKIYLPRTHEGELAMIRSIISYLKLWFKCDYSLLQDAKHLNQLAVRFEQIKFRPVEGFKGKSPQRQFLGGRRNSVNLQSSDLPSRCRQQGGRVQNLLMENRSTKQIGKSPNRDNQMNFLSSSISNKPQLKFNQMTAETDKGNGDFEHRSFNSNNNLVSPLTKSIGMNSNSNYFPNKTTSNKNHIVNMINKLDNTSDYVKNKLLLDDERLKQLQKDKLKKMKQSLDGIGQELNDLFVSNIQNQQQDNHQVKKKLEQEFQNLLA